MNKHTNFLTVQAATNYELGLQLGSHFRPQVQAKMEATILTCSCAV